MYLDIYQGERLTCSCCSSQSADFSRLRESEVDDSWEGRVFTSRRRHVLVSVVGLGLVGWTQRSNISADYDFTLILQKLFYPVDQDLVTFVKVFFLLWNIVESLVRMQDCHEQVDILLVKVQPFLDDFLLQLE